MKKKNTDSIGFAPAKPQPAVAAPVQLPSSLPQAPQPAPAKVIDLAPPPHDVLPVSITAEPEPVMLPKPAPQSVNPIFPPAPPEATSTTRRINKSFIDLDAVIDAELKSQQAERKEVTLELVQSIWQMYKDSIPPTRSSLRSQLTMMDMEFYPPDEVRIICKDEMIESAANNERNTLIDLFRKESENPLRVRVELRKDMVIKEEGPKVLSKPEVLEEMKKKNPSLAKLCDALNMQIEW